VVRQTIDELHVVLATTELRDPFPDAFRHSPRRVALATDLGPGVERLQFSQPFYEGAFDKHADPATGPTISP
jgi:hypothetical protein